MHLAVGLHSLLTAVAHQSTVAPLCSSSAPKTTMPHCTKSTNKHISWAVGPLLSATELTVSPDFSQGRRMSVHQSDKTCCCFLYIVAMLVFYCLWSVYIFWMHSVFMSTCAGSSSEIVNTLLLRVGSVRRRWSDLWRIHLQMLSVIPAYQAQLQALYFCLFPAGVLG